MRTRLTGMAYTQEADRSNSGTKRSRNERDYASRVSMAKVMRLLSQQLVARLHTTCCSSGLPDTSVLLQHGVSIKMLGPALNYTIAPKHNTEADLGKTAACAEAKCTAGWGSQCKEAGTHSNAGVPLAVSRGKIWLCHWQGVRRPGMGNTVQAWHGFVRQLHQHRHVMVFSRHDQHPPDQHLGTCDAVPGASCSAATRPCCWSRSSACPALQWPPSGNPSPQLDNPGCSQGGEVIKALRTETGARIKVLESVDGAQERVVVASSPATAEGGWAPAQLALFRVHSCIVDLDGDSSSARVEARLSHSTTPLAQDSSADLHAHILDHQRLLRGHACRQPASPPPGLGAAGLACP